MADSTETAGTTTAAITPLQEPVCSSCGLPLHVLKGGLQIGSDGASIVNVAILGCSNNNYLGSNTPCAQFNVEQARNETPVNTFVG